MYIKLAKQGKLSKYKILDVIRYNEQLSKLRSLSGNNSLRRPKKCPSSYMLFVKQLSN